jgi:hypothetical protein
MKPVKAFLVGATMVTTLLKVLADYNPIKNKIYISSVIVIFLLFCLPACERKQEIQPEPVTTKRKNEALEQFSLAVAGATADPGFRKLIKTEVNKQFDYDFDVLYRFIADREITTELGKTKVSDFLTFHLNKPHVASKKESVNSLYLQNLVDLVDNLQISIPNFGAEWDAEGFIPKVVVLPVDFDEKTVNQVKAFDQFGNVSWVGAEEALQEPYIVVRESERVDINGKLRVDKYGFVLPEEMRLTVAEAAYIEAHTAYLNGTLDERNNFEPIIEVVDDEYLIGYSQSTKGVSYKGTTSMYDGSQTLYPNARTAAVSMPTNVSVYPSNPYSMYIKWQDVPEATYYKIYREVNYSGNYSLIATKSKSEGQTHSDNFLTLGNLYTYQIQAFNGSDTDYSARTLTTGARASWRRNNGREVIQKIYISRECWNWCCGLFDGKIELQYRLIKYNKQDNTVEYPEYNLGQRTKNQQKDTWHTYTTSLFDWDVTKYAYNYMLYFYEDDGGNGRGVEITLGMKFTAGIKDAISAEQNASVKFTLDDRDEEMGYVEIYHYDPTGKNYYLGPKKGQAIVVVAQ